MKIVWPAALVVLVILAAGLLAGHASCTKTDVALIRPDLAQTNKSPEVDIAVHKAKATLDEFLDRYEHPKPTDRGFGVQAAFESTNGPEYIWVHLRRYSNGTFTGLLANEPEAIAGKHKGDSVSVKRDQVTDWIYESDGRQVGGFTIDAIKSAAGG